MSTETKFGEAATTVEEVAFGAAKTAAEVASDPIGSARKQVKGFERKGAPTARKLNRRFNARLNAILPEKVTLFGLEINGKLPEKVAIKGLHLVKLRQIARTWSATSPSGRCASSTARSRRSRAQLAVSSRPLPRRPVARQLLSPRS